MDERFAYLGVAVPHIRMPAPQVDLARWAVVACDQFTSQPEYWQQVAAQVGDAPSTLHMIYPEAFLSQGDARIPGIHAAMAGYLADGTLAQPRQGMMLVARQVEYGTRLGLVLSVDLEQYDFMPGADCAIRPTEGTILERIPPRVRVRQGGALELPHVMLLADDPENRLIAPLYEKRDALEPCYDVQLMLEGGRLQGWWVPQEAHPAIADALEACRERGQGLLFAVGDGNHSLATARQCWLEIRNELSAEERQTHPARWAMVEVVNLHDDALQFEPIHRVLFGIEPGEVMAAWERAAEDAGLRPSAHRANGAGDSLMMLTGQGEKPMFYGSTPVLPLAALQSFLDGYLAEHSGASIDYIHGEAALRTLCNRPDALGFLLFGMEKRTLFPHIATQGVLPRKAFSMGEAHEKRYYMETRKIVP